MERQLARLVRALVVVGLAIGVGALVWMISSVLDRVSNVLTIVIYSILFSYLIYPAVKRLAPYMPRAVAIAVVYAGIFVVVLIALAFLAPTVVVQAQDFALNYPKLVAAVQQSIAHPSTNPVMQRFPPQVRELVAKNAAKVGEYLGVVAAALGGRILPAVQSGATLVTELAVMFGVTFMFIVDLEKIQVTMLRMVPRDRRPAAISLVEEIDVVIGGFIRSQVLLAIVTAVASILVLLVLGVPYAVLLGVLIGVLSIVPIVGALVGAIPAVIVALVTVGLIKATIVTVLLIVIFQVIGNLVAPLINAKLVNVTPLLITLAILIGGEAYGILGILLAVPVAGILRVVYDRLFPSDPESERLVLSSRAESGDVTHAGERVGG